jgi:transcription initiation factor TFIIIB Brf1 subunit/transcription initiation factor TFIIB
MIDQRPEWYDDAGARAGVDKFEPFLGPQIAPGRNIRYHEPDQHKNTKLGLQQVEFCGSKLHLDSDHQICTTAKKIFADYAESRKAQGRGIRENERLCAAACALYFGCKSNERPGDRFPRTIKEISGACGVPVQSCVDMVKSFKALLVDKPYTKLLFTTVNPEDVLVRALNGIDFKVSVDRHAVAKTARVFFERIKARHLLEGRTPETVCAAVLYRSFEINGIKVMKKSIYKACNVTGVTLNKALDDLKAL